MLATSVAPNRTWASGPSKAGSSRASPRTMSMTVRAEAKDKASKGDDLAESYWKSASRQTHWYPVYSRPWGKKAGDASSPPKGKADGGEGYVVPTNKGNAKGWPGMESYWYSAGKAAVPIPEEEGERPEAEVPGYWESAAKYTQWYPNWSRGGFGSKAESPKPKDTKIEASSAVGPPTRDEAMKSWPGMNSYWMSAAKTSAYTDEQLDAMVGTDE